MMLMMGMMIATFLWMKSMKLLAIVIQMKALGDYDADGCGSTRIHIRTHYHTHTHAYTFTHAHTHTHKLRHTKEKDAHMGFPESSNYYYDSYYYCY